MSKTYDDGLQSAINIINDLLEAIRPLEVKFPGRYEHRILILELAIRCIEELRGVND